jgi:hypothetical protein
MDVAEYEKIETILMRHTCQWNGLTMAVMLAVSSGTGMRKADES